MFGRNAIVADGAQTELSVGEAVKTELRISSINPLIAKYSPSACLSLYIFTYLILPF